MRRIALLLPLALACIAVGCNWLDTKKKPDDARVSPTGKRLNARPADEFVTFLNRQSNAVQSVRYNSVSLKVTAPDMWAPRLNDGWLVCSKPNNFRMQSGLMVGGSQLDLGSNRDEMWMYVKQSQTPYMFCSHADFPKVQDTLPVKFEPDWVLQALGMTTYDPTRKYEIESSERTNAYFLKYADVTAAGEPVTKVTEFAGTSASSDEPQVRRHAILAPAKNGKGQVTVAVADIKKVSTVKAGTNPQTGQPVYAQVPTEVVLEWPLQKVKMELSLKKLEVNEKLSPQDSEYLFARPKQINNASPVNLADFRYPSAVPSGTTRGATPDLPRFVK